MFYTWLDARFGSQPGALVVGTWALAGAYTPDDAWRAGRPATSPGEFDVLRASLRDALWRGSTLEDVFAEFAVARTTAPLAPPEPEAAWRIAWPEHARRLASPRPVAPTGASYVVVDHARAPAGARLRLEAQWEDYGLMRWAAIELRADGSALRVIPLAAPERSTQAAVTLGELDGVDRVVAVGANVGSTEHPFRPNQGEWEPHAWTLTVEGE
jgi:hypothetical protein